MTGNLIFFTSPSCAARIQSCARGVHYFLLHFWNTTWRMHTWKNTPFQAEKPPFIAHQGEQKWVCWCNLAIGTRAAVAKLLLIMVTGLDITPALGNVKASRPSPYRAASGWEMLILCSHISTSRILHLLCLWCVLVPLGSFNLPSHKDLQTRKCPLQ